MGIALGLVAALCWGGADFLARFATRRLGTYRTSFFMQIIGFLLLSLYLGARDGWNFSGASAAGGWPPWAWAVLAGLLNTGCSLAFYRSLEMGVLAIVAPIASSYPALTLILSMLSGEKISRVSGAGIFLVLGGVMLASTAFETNGSFGGAVTGRHSAGHLARGVGWAILSALGFGVMFWLLGFRVMPVLGGVPSVWVIRLTTFVTLALVAPSGRTLRPPAGRAWWLLMGVAVLDTSAFLANNIGLATGRVAVVTVLASLFGAVTVLLAWIFLRERLERSQWLGVVLIFVGVVLVSL